MGSVNSRFAAVLIGMLMLTLSSAPASAAPTAELAGERKAGGSVAERLSEDALEQVNLDAAPEGQAWFKVVDEKRRDSSVDPRTGEIVTSTGKYVEYTLDDENATVATGSRLTDTTRNDSVANASAAGCSVSNYVAPAARWWSRWTADYRVRAYSWKETSAGCAGATSGWWIATLDELHGFYTPEVARGTNTAAPGTGRHYIWLYYGGIGQGHCEDYLHNSMYDLTSTVCAY